MYKAELTNQANDARCHLFKALCTVADRTDSLRHVSTKLTAWPSSDVPWHPIWLEGHRKYMLRASEVCLGQRCLDRHFKVTLFPASIRTQNK